MTAVEQAEPAVTEQPAEQGESPPAQPGPPPPADASADAPAGQPPLSARVEISVGQHQVVVEATDRLPVVANTALEMWKATDGAGARRLECTMGFQFDVEPGPLPAEVALPDRMVDDGEDEDSRGR